MTTSRRLAPLPLLLIGMAVLCAVLTNVPWVVHAQTPVNQDATGRPVVLASAEGAGILFADTEGIADGNGLPITVSGSSFVTYTWSYQWIRVDGNSDTNVGANSASYQPVEADVGNKIKVRVSFRDRDNYSEARTSLPFGPIAELTRTSAPPSTLVSNTGQSASANADITQRYAVGFRLGDHGQGYEISSVSIELAAVPSSLTVSLWSGGVEGGLQANTATKLFDFANPSSFAVGLNEFTAPAGAFAYQNVNYFIVLSGFGTTLSIKETTSDDEDTGGETGAVIYDKAAVRALSDTGPWGASGSRASVLRLAVEGSKRARGIVASNYAQPRIDDMGTDDTSDDTGPHQEIISLGDEIGFGIELGAADRYLIRGVSWNMDDSTPSGSGFTNPWDLRSGSRTGAVQFSLTNTRKAPGLPVWTAPQGATVAGGCPTSMGVKTCKKYVFDHPIGPDDGDDITRRRDAILERVAGAATDGVDDPAAAGVSFTGGKGDVAITDPYMALLGEPLDAMVQNLGQANNGYVSADTTNDVLSQGFTTGPANFGYRLQGIGFNIEGSGSNFPDGPTSVSVAVHADSNGQPGTKLVDLVSPTEYAAGHSFFEAPPGTHLEKSTSYVLVWRHLGGTVHRLQRTSSDFQDAPALAAFSIANVFYRGADLDNLSADSGSNALEIAAYGEVNTETVVYIMVPPEPPPPPTFIPGVTGGGGAILRCSSPPAASCPTYDDVSAENILWSATLTAGEQVSGTSVFRVGFNRGNNRPDTGAISDDSFDLNGVPHVVTRIQINFPTLLNSLALTLDTAIGEEADQLILHLDSVSLPLRNATVSNLGVGFTWTNHGLTWSDNESIEVKISRPRTPNAYGYRTIWNALMTAEQHPTVLTRYGYSNESYGKLTNNIIVNGRTDRGVVDDQFRYPWSGFEITQLTDDASKTRVTFDEDSHPTDDEVARWTLTLGGGVELPFSKATHPQVGTDTLANAFEFSHTPNWTAGDQVLVSIRTEDVQNRYGLVALSARRSTKSDGNNIVYGKTHYTYPRQPTPGISYARGDGKFGPGALWELQNLRVTTDKTGDTDPVWITATFRAPNQSDAWTGYWEGQFDDFHTLFLRWIYHEGGVGRGAVTYTLPLRAAATEGGIQRSRSAGEVTFTWVRTYKEFQRRHLDLANHSDLFADMLAPPKPATRLTSFQNSDDFFQNSDDFSEQGVYDPAPTVTSVGFTSDPGSDRVYGPGDTIEVTVTFDQDVTVGYVNSKQDAAKLDLEVGGQTRTAHYARTDGNKVIFEYTVRPGDEAPSYLLLRHNSLRLYRDTPSEDGSIRNSSGGDAVLDHYGIADTGHRVDTVGPEFANAQVSSDGAQVAVTFNESIRSPAILRWFGVQTSLLQSLALDVRVDGEIAVRSDAAVSGDTVTLTVSEPITQGQTVTVSYDNLFIETGESIFEDLRGNSLLPFAEQPATNGSAVADVDRPGGGLALSRNDLLIREGQSGTYTVALTSQPAADVTVAIGDHPAGRATVSPASLTFTAHNWNTPQTVTITSPEDSDYVDRWVLLQHVATGDNYGASAAAWLILRDNYNLTTTTPNTPATGSPTISGTPQVGQTLTLDISEIADADGLTNASYTYLYQWLRNDAEIAGQTASTYTLASADQGQTIKVKVSFLDDVNNQESRTSAETEPVAAKPNTEATGEPTISGTPQVGETLSADVSGIGDADGLTNVSYRYQWVAGGSDIGEATGSSYLLTAGEQGQTIQVKVTFTDDADNQESLTSAETLAVAAKPNAAATGEPTISGTPQVDETLTADTSAISDEDGLANVSYQYQWLRDDADIAGQTSSTYRLVSADQDKTIKVRVTFRDDADNAESLTSTATTAVATQPTSPLTASFANVPADHDGSNFTFDLTFSENVNAGYARIQDHAFTVSGGAIASASRKTQGSNQGWTVEVDPTGNGSVSITLPETTDCDASGAICTEDSRKLSHPTSATVAGPPAISVSDATVQEAEGAVLVFTATLSHASSRTVTVDYATSDGTAVAGSDYNAASGALTFNAGDTSQTVQVTVLTDSEDESQETLTLTLSNPSQATLDDATGAGAIENGESSSGTVVNSPPNGLPTVSGTPQVGETLTTDTSNIDDEDGLTNVSYSYQWIRSEDGNADTDIEDATDSTYTLTGGDVGKTIQVKVTFTDDADNQESLTSEATETVAAAAPASLTAAFHDLPDSHDGSTAFTFRVLFSEDVGISYVTMRDDAFSLSEGDVTGARRVDGRNDLWEITVEPDDNSDVGITLPANRSCTTTGAICTREDSPRQLTNSPTATVTGPAEAPPTNTSAAGAPTISGTPQVEQTLTADTSSITDEDGLTNVSYSYQWIAGGSDIAGATGSTYTLTASEQGQTIQVRVTFTDDADNEETLTSEATETVAAAAPASLTAAFHDLPDSHDGSTAFTFRILFSEDVGISYVNMRDDAFSLSEGDVTGARRVDGRNDLWEITVEPDDNSDVGITLPANRSCTTTGAICTREDSPRQLTNSPTATVTGPAEAPPTNTSAAGAPTISGTPQVEQTLTADTSPITDEDGLTNVSYSYQWIAGGSDIAGATGSTYTLTASEQGQTIQVRVTFTDDADNEETLTSEATAEVTAAPAPLTASLPDSRFQSARHNGADDRPQVIVAFSLPVASFEKTTPSVSLTGAAVSSVRRHQEDGLENAWIFFLDSDGDGDIVFSLATGQPCDSGGICTEDGEMLSEGVQVTLPGPEEEAGDDQQTP